MPFNYPNRHYKILTKQVNKKVETLQIKAEVVEIYDKDYRHFIKMIYKPGIVDIEVDKQEELHLGDKFIISASFDKENMIGFQGENH